MPLISLIPAILLALAVMLTYKEYELMITPEKKGKYYLPALFWALFYLSIQL